MHSSLSILTEVAINNVLELSCWINWSMRPGWMKDKTKKNRRRKKPKKWSQRPRKTAWSIIGEILKSHRERQPHEKLRITWENHCRERWTEPWRRRTTEEMASKTSNWAKRKAKVPTKVYQRNNKKTSDRKRPKMPNPSSRESPMARNEESKKRLAI